MSSSKTCYSHQIGRESEIIVLHALNGLLRQRLIIGFAQIDLPGIDFYVILRGYKFIPLQVKSSFVKAQKHRKRYPDIDVIVIPHQTLLKRKTFNRFVQNASREISLILHIAS